MEIGFFHQVQPPTWPFSKSHWFAIHTALSCDTTFTALLAHTVKATGELQEGSQKSKGRGSPGSRKTTTLLSMNKRAPFRALKKVFVSLRSAVTSAELRSETRVPSSWSTRRVFMSSCHMTFLCVECYPLCSWFLYFTTLHVIG